MSVSFVWCFPLLCLLHECWLLLSSFKEMSSFVFMIPIEYPIYKYKIFMRKKMSIIHIIYISCPHYLFPWGVFFYWGGGGVFFPSTFPMFLFHACHYLVYSWILTLTIMLTIHLLLTSIWITLIISSSYIFNSSH